AFVQNQGNCWNTFVHALARRLEDDLRLDQAEADTEPAFAGPLDYPLDLVSKLGERTGEMHAAFGRPTDNVAFQAAPIEQKDLDEWIAEVKAQTQSAHAALEAAGDRLPAAVREQAHRLIAARNETLNRIDRFSELQPIGTKSRIHGDYHLGQVLVAQQDVYIIDFEGEPGRSLEERRAKTSPLRDVAGMLRSFDYAVWTAVLQVAGQVPEPDWNPVSTARAWRERLQRDFMTAYWQMAPGNPESTTTEGLLRLFLFQKAFYEIEYELSNRPDRVAIPLQGVLDLLGGES